MQKDLHNALALVRSFLQKDGGDIEIVEITADNIVRVRLLGQCKGCPNAGQTLRSIVERTILKMVPAVRGVESID